MSGELTLTVSATGHEYNLYPIEDMGTPDYYVLPVISNKPEFIAGYLQWDGNNETTFNYIAEDYNHTIAGVGRNLEDALQILDTWLIGLGVKFV